MQRTVTSNNDELIIISSVVNRDFWISSNDLLLGGKIVVFLELEIAKRTRESKIACGNTI